MDIETIAKVVLSLGFLGFFFTKSVNKKMATTQMYSDDDLKYMALTLFGEARGEPLQGKIAVCQTILERVKDKRWPNTVKEVCIQPYQFSCWNNNDPNKIKINKLLNDWPSSIEQNSDLQQCYSVAKGVLSEIYPNIANGANHYHTISIEPYWSKGQYPVAYIGKHKFYNLS